MGSMLRRFSRIATYAIVLSCCFVTYSCKKTPDYINGHEYVDLGLSVKWATCNVGASSPEDYGDYYAWGEITPKDEYTKKNSSPFGKDISDIAGNPDYDAARANWGGTWRMPTVDEFQELIDSCKWKSIKCHGVKGMLVKSKKNGNSIFLPAAGYRGGTSLYYAGKWGYGFYLSSSLSKDSGRPAYGLLFCCYDRWSPDGYSERYSYLRLYGRSVRPVTE